MICKLLLHQIFFFSFGSNNLLNYDKQHNNNNIAPMEEKVY